MTTVGTRLNRFLYETERHYPAATGELSDLLSQLAFAGKRISRILSSAGLTEILGTSGGVNIQGEQQQKLDALANEVFLEAFAFGQLVPTIVTEEMDLPGTSRRTSSPASTSSSSTRSTARRTST